MSFVDATVSSLAVRAIHLVELRDAVNSALTLLGIPPISGATPLASGGTILIRLADFQQVRNAVR